MSKATAHGAQLSAVHDASGAGAAADAAWGALHRAIYQVSDRIEEVLAEEVAILEGRATGSIEAIVARKNHLVVELMRLMQHCNGACANEQLRRRLSGLSTKLADNAQLLRRHIDAIGEVTAIIAGAISAAGDDGTYSGRPQHAGGRP